MRILASALTIAITTGISGNAFAHAGHGVGSSASIAHYMTEPVHLVGAVLSLIVLAVGVRLWLRKAEPSRIGK